MVAVGSIIQSRTNDALEHPAFKLSLAWTSDASGNVSGIPALNISGVLSRVTFIPAAGGVAPTALYDVTLLDDDGVDVLAGLGIDRSATLKESVYPLLGGAANVPAVCVGSLNLVVANAGNAKQGSISLYFRRGSA